MEFHFRALAGELMAHGNPPSQAGLQYRRGFFAGMKALLDSPLIARNEIEREINKGVNQHGED